MSKTATHALSSVLLGCWLLLCVGACATYVPPVPGSVASIQYKLQKERQCYCREAIRQYEKKKRVELAFNMGGDSAPLQQWKYCWNYSKQPYYVVLPEFLTKYYDPDKLVRCPGD